MSSLELTNGLLDFVRKSPTPYHAAQSMATLLSVEGFKQLNEMERWNLTPGGRYFVVRGGASVLAFIVGTEAVEESGIRIIGAHTDSPCLKVKPLPEIQSKGYAQLGVEVYGGALLNPWFDRDLSIAGRISYLSTSGELKTALIDFENAIASIPSLAIHLDREANNSRRVNPQTDMNAILHQADEPKSFRALLLDVLDDKNAKEVLDFNLSFYDTQPPAVLGLENDFIASARLDNLLSCYLGVRALIDAGTNHTSVLICNDHEEVGSRSDIGAQGPLLDEVIERLTVGGESRQITLRRSLMFSVDNAHGVHPNYVNKHDDKHGPIINKGPVIKFDANQSYATSSATAALVRWLASSPSSLPLQTYVTRADTRCGSTIGPITAAGIGITTVDIGVPTFAMHSIREFAGVIDLVHMNTLLNRFLTVKNLPYCSNL
ncbi:M18 family aminopeptidase [Teredinibacter purpureus]|uniref:M18 family aminopeptidase n=1 Tax=Teredinibacter purpureus TaxID=2731756 RepID=UPI0005F7AACD|nr:M18 family aminopeptidase [Teredinibacter purpureus]